MLLVLRKSPGKKRPVVVTFFVPETCDRRVVEDDAAVFGDTATIHEVTEEDGLSKIRSLVERNG